ncbi:MAG: trypsin-like peptidase domain-containing protein, partial [Planctomycetota bacterium]
MACKLQIVFKIVATLLAIVSSVHADESLSQAELDAVCRLERQRVETIQKVMGSVIAIYGEERQGGGSGVIIHPSGIGLTNHHVITGAGIKGWGGLADGNLYRWELIGTDPGGDVAIIQMVGKEEFPYSKLADSDTVRVGDWSLAMGNPFVLTEDQSPTVTLGIVSGIKRYQPGASSSNQLVYGNCIQTDSSINPGNSGGPLFNLKGEVIGINGRGSFKERGRVNVGLGYAISSNQIKNFIPDLLATKLVEHGTLDANFEDRNGKVVCSNLYEDSKLYKLGVRPGDQLLEFEGESIQTANQFTNLICTLPENWPAEMLIQKADGTIKRIVTRLYGLPYQKPQRPPLPPEKDQTPEQKEQIKRVEEMMELLSAPPGEIRYDSVNQKYAGLVERYFEKPDMRSEDQVRVWEIHEEIYQKTKLVGQQKIRLTSEGKFNIEMSWNSQSKTFRFDGKQLQQLDSGSEKVLSKVQFKDCRDAFPIFSIMAMNQIASFDLLGTLFLDGSDRAQNQRSFRMRRTDADGESMYFWF